MTSPKVLAAAREQAAGNSLVEVSVGNRSAQSYWDRKLTLKETSALLNVQISALTHGVVTGKLPDGRPCPKVAALTTNGVMFFNGLDVKAVMEMKK